MPCCQADKVLDVFVIQRVVGHFSVAALFDKAQCFQDAKRRDIADSLTWSNAATS